ncbi:hypothetical protein MmTuc01_1263 [Methanosarcina mazei Tuc01]|uniref:Uncharacterized protein n=1 Tax=Methanosarcina mazei Tuc01 TaxID=1236903 RepID=M1QI51_METMZ|nr:hypothetical protein MmTuc01_1263 [Methanosarcina mazei Tuc01]
MEKATLTERNVCLLRNHPFFVFLNLIISIRLLRLYRHFQVNHTNFIKGPE